MIYIIQMDLELINTFHLNQFNSCLGTFILEHVGEIMVDIY